MLGYYCGYVLLECFEYYCVYYPEILPQTSLKQETKIDGRGYEILFEKVAGSCNI